MVSFVALYFGGKDDMIVDLFTPLLGGKEVMVVVLFASYCISLDDFCTGSNVCSLNSLPQIFVLGCTL